VASGDPLPKAGPCPNYLADAEFLVDVFYSRPPMHPLTHDEACEFAPSLSDHERVQVMVALGR
jgi:hypothetical protein